ncbi:Protein of unknown function [Lactobacillus acidophilus DSM 9126]|nr:Protein of unknown function [Lactobacillus acidophilus DSM 20079 = JCM 1132 = NBRC 13951 = CIP 76.13]CDF69546.1 Protein of unknown function [Lactobacillus acidophilus CIRM-BIA 442]CDF71342.1 Protein of unknown function [Lactobacillus acidophilus CIRM-BIA 445]CDF73172.1 Protein of unknown function [Lactobacillus acidophilus DSM 9126]CDF75161.1 Protein of unknown function [Lactobacillus acidophilus DSM 20242]
MKKKLWITAQVVWGCLICFGLYVAANL